MTKKTRIFGHGSRKIARYSLAVLYGVAGILHVTLPAPFLAITPSWVPFAPTVILLTGLCEIAAALALLTHQWRRLAGYGLALYAVCVYPANIKHAIDGLSSPDAVLGWWYHGPRLALQPVLVWWALFTTHIIDWPFRARA